MGLAEREISSLATMAALSGLLPDQDAVRPDAMMPGGTELAARSVFFHVSVGMATVTAHIGTMLYASMFYAVMVWVRPRARPAWAACWAVAICFAIEAFQLTGIPADLPAALWPIQTALGSRFDWIDMAAYPPGAVCAAALHWVWARSTAPPAPPVRTFRERVEHLKKRGLPAIVKE